MFNHAVLIDPCDINSVSIATKQQAYDFIDNFKVKPIHVTNEMSDFIVSCYLNNDDIFKKHGLYPNRVCKLCSGNLILKNGKFGPVYCCPNYPKCSGCFVATYLYDRPDLDKFQHYLYKIKDDFNKKFNVKINQSFIKKHLDDLGLECLCEKYTGEHIKSILIPGKVKKRSNEIERTIFNIAESQCPDFKVVSQQGLFYTLKPDIWNKRLSIIDLIISNSQIINLIEIKIGSYDCADIQLSNYVSLIDFLENEKGICRKVAPCFVVSKMNGNTYTGSSAFKIMHYDDLPNYINKQCF